MTPSNWTPSDYIAAVRRAILADQPRIWTWHPDYRTALIAEAWDRGDLPQEAALSILQTEGFVIPDFYREEK